MMRVALEGSGGVEELDYAENNKREEEQGKQEGTGATNIDLYKASRRGREEGGAGGRTISKNR